MHHICDGTILDIMEYQALFAVIGMNYGGDGRNTFALPNLRARIPIGVGQGQSGYPYQIGRQGGYEYITIAEDNLPSHSHAIDSSGGGSGGSSTADLKVVNAGGTTSDPSSAKSIAGKAGAFNVLSTSDTTTTIKGAVTGIQGGGSVPPETEATGGGEALYNMPPFQVVNYIICIDGMFPPRN